MVMLIVAGAVPGLEEVMDLLTLTTYNALAENITLLSVAMLLVLMSMTNTTMLGVSLVGMVYFCQQ